MILLLLLLLLDLSFDSATHTPSLIVAFNRSLSLSLILLDELEMARMEVGDCIIMCYERNSFVSKKRTLRWCFLLF